MGNIAIIEIPKELEKGEKRIAKSILSMHKHISTVLKKKGGHEGVYRRQKMIFLAGKDIREATYKEHNAILRLDVEKVYFSPRLSTERKRIFSQIKKGEKVLVMFSGCGVYPIVISKNTKAAEVYGVEINPIGHKYALINSHLNKTVNIKFFKGDAKNVVPTLKQKFDRIVMPLPKDAGLFLDTAFKASKKGTIIHMYDFSEEVAQGRTPSSSIDEINASAKKAKRKCKILGWTKCGQIGPREFRICVDFKMLN